MPTLVRTDSGPRPRRRLLVASAVLAGAIACFLLLFVRGSFEFAVERRATMLGAMAVAAFAHGLGTVVFHTVTDNRLLTPSIVGFDSLYVLMQTVMVYVFGGSVIARTDGTPKVIAQTLTMVLFATVLYRWLFSGRLGSLFTMLLVGVVLGLAFDSLSTFLQRLLSPTEYDLLSVRLFGRLSGVDPDMLPLAFTVCVAVGVVLWRRRFRLDALLLGRDSATTIGVDHKRELTLVLVLVALLVSFSTALAGPMTFFGFIVATMAYQVTGSYKHQYVLPMAFLLGMLTLVVGQFVMQHIFYAAGFLTVVIEFAGGLLFLVVVLRKGRL
ncbi:iron chelate uptake ABC transporter family permease subunit [Rhodococcus sp. BP-149]|uniref:iron chelate uptake ABC transporter family permease subunit n=1 Tax=unclassified Rhodococcus (in: high G+C Gram-positive bacteria) TaxID=192944 RepID=UPI001DA6C0F0|nr:MULTISPECIES: iron chelate uptake ABC transporter family permease subunit [unclassified Rhodococcus (in: high G+C Gram-positive bacteria)]MBY6685559.1 iron chelate uptake ABC transporter family permease subunit [Rhodococcus sp. BP-288]MBY6694876.1 iron chelate uptake ABC transporter family permease subunit [Rhodococcus sp. BP-188]MBY6696739.1 iron chelate uptake ABC transporter family permease subunit [Rhodococcus sp. BP-285]MBY6703395.1 iron chelate uptake ABC transporter family permease su